MPAELRGEIIAPVLFWRSPLNRRFLSKRRMKPALPANKQWVGDERTLLPTSSMPGSGLPQGRAYIALEA